MNAADEARDVSEITRRAVLDQIARSWSGTLDEVDFLKRLYDVDSLPSFDPRFPSASGDVWKHRVINDDWPDDWVFTDNRFNILRGSDMAFLRFLAETVHPLVRDPHEAELLVIEFNKELVRDGWLLAVTKQLSGRPVYGPARADSRASTFEEPTGWPKVDRQVQEARQLLSDAGFEEQYQAVGLVCREIMISVAQAHYDPDRHPAQDGKEPSDTDAARMIENIFAVDLGGSANEEARAHAKASLKLAVALQHRRTADFRTAALCLEASLSVVNIVSIVAGRRDR